MNWFKTILIKSKTWGYYIEKESVREIYWGLWSIYIPKDIDVIKFFKDSRVSISEISDKKLKLTEMF